jgi:phosphohistidine phosphatase
MRTLMLLRHAKSSWDDPDLADHERPLTRRGKEAAARMGQLLAEEGLAPDLILSSTAVRARKTAQAAAKASGHAGEVQLLESLYLATAGKLMGEVQALAPETARRVLVVAHNPGMEDLVAILSGQKERFPTAALAVFVVDIDDWRSLELGVATRLTHIFRPKELRPNGTQ